MPEYNDYFRPSAKLVDVRTNHEIYDTATKAEKQKFSTKDFEKRPAVLEFVKAPMIGGDILLKIYHTCIKLSLFQLSASFKSTKIFRVAFNTAFLTIANDNTAYKFY